MTLEEQIAQSTDPQEFTRLCNTIFTAKYGHDFQVIDGTRSDDGNDGYIISEKRILAMHCPVKPERKTDSDYLKKIRSDIGKAQSLRDSGKYDIEKWTFLTPRKLSNAVIVEMRKLAESMGLDASHQESTFLATELANNKGLVIEFPDLHISELDSKLDEIITLLKAKDINQEQTEEEIDDKNIYKGKTDNQEELDRVLNLRSELRNKDTNTELKTIYYKTSDKTVKLNALLGLLDNYDPVEDAADDMVLLCNEGITIAETIDAPSVKAHILAQKGYLVSFIYSELDMQTAFQVMADNAIGFPTITEEYRQSVIKKLKSLETEFDNAFNEAINLTKSNNDYYTLASVLIFIGNASGQRALYLQNLDVKDRAASEKATCRRALLTAKEIYDAFNDELSSTNALFNLANQIRFFGEEQEAMELAKNALFVANKHGDNRLSQRSEWLIRTLETGEMPDYAAGERRE